MSASAVRHRTETIDGLDVSYREAGDPGAPALVLLHGFPSSSHMFRHLLGELADEYHLVAPDHIGFGRSAMPPVHEFDYSFDRLAQVTAALLDRIGLTRFALYLHDYGAPIGLRIAAGNPERVTALITQSGNAYREGFTPFWEPLFAHAQDRTAHEPAVRALLEPEATRWQYVHGVPEDRLDRVAPEAWLLDQMGLDRPGNKEIQLQLFWDYQFNLDAYPAFQEYFRAWRPPTLVTWGRGDEIFGPAGAEAFARDLPDAEIHLLDAGHFALETHGPEIANLVRGFLGRTLPGRTPEAEGAWSDARAAR
ncbi:alpha/beta hydrolase [Rhodococcus ruber]|uniref:Putative enzyme n=1 Tax=Rhodococcus ruber TaxID=1830 RepID=A0A098BJP4_9NOCA|nr:MULTISPECIES: alpha/beta hydrolase [Rhodococcus]MDO2379221.1 alpha/beta hydrolase [Rhodococcus ruber]RIK06846.1 MAG: alpha/beta hydrolase [Acidobacteriota bacterium]AUM15737.1 alpha/beta hydrolase [Rhodococcus ruber]AWG98650.1 alpha/beta hydrolase [Rhodococcus ruber]AXY51607.1 alpha/beta hydrolase [Rhodococcus ruber]